MAYDKSVSLRLKTALLGEDVSERKMFGGLAYMMNGNMCCGVVNDQVVLRLGKEGVAKALEDPNIREMEFTGRPMPTMVYMDGFVSDSEFEDWVAEAVAFTRGLQEK